MKQWIGWTVAVVAIIALTLWIRDGAPQTEEAFESLPSHEALGYVQQEETSTAPNITTNIRETNGMKIEVLTEGSGPEITNGQTATVEYTGILSDGSVFDASARHGQPFSFPLGAGRVIKGWDQGVLGMKIGETRKLTIPPELGYGAAGYPPVIPQNATLIFEVTLRAIN